MDRLLHKLEDKVDRLLGHEHQDHSHTAAEGCDDSHPVEHRENRYHSFAPQTSGVPKWYVDGASYFWAVSEALERESFFPTVILTQRNHDMMAAVLNKLFRGSGEHLHPRLVA